MEQNSPLRFLDYDVTQYLYETYFPSKQTRTHYNMVVSHYNLLRRNYNIIDKLVEQALNERFTYTYKTCNKRTTYDATEFITYIKRHKYRKTI